MRMAHDFVAARHVAQHCAELVARGPRPEEREALVNGWRRALAQHLAELLGALLAGERIEAEVGAPEILKGADVLARIGPVAANSLLRCGDDTGGAVLLSLDHATALALAEKSFGGEGRVGEASLDPLPRSALLLMDEVAALIAQALAKAKSGGGPAPSGAAPRGEVIVRSENAARLRPFDAGDDCALITLRLRSGVGIEWRARLALAAGRLDQVLPPAETAAASPAKPAAHRRSDAAAAFGAIPLALHAVLAEFDMTLSQLDRLAPGDTIPLAMPRMVPLRIGDALVAHGSIGTLEDRIALRLTKVAPPQVSGFLSNQGVSQ
ncbi:MAG: FliM/FliN family flagellar motor C-terminal domain-containing protein [Erythrobacter sp.]